MKLRSCPEMQTATSSADSPVGAGDGEGESEGEGEDEGKGEGESEGEGEGEGEGILLGLRRKHARREATVRARKHGDDTLDMVWKCMQGKIIIGTGAALPRQV